MENVTAMFEDMRPMLKRLKKTSYEKNTEKFIERYSSIIQEMINYVEASDQKKASAKKICKEFTGEVKNKFSSPKGKINSGVQADLNLFMIFYVFPTILKSSSSESKMITETLCNQWREEFKGNDINYTDYDTLHKSFRDKIFGIF